MKHKAFNFLGYTGKGAVTDIDKIAGIFETSDGKGEIYIVGENDPFITKESYQELHSRYEFQLKLMNPPT